jgi:hypothetical protein
MVCDLAGAEALRREPENLAMTIGEHRPKHGGATGRLESPSVVVPTSPMAIGRKLIHRLLTMYSEARRRVPTSRRQPSLKDKPASWILGEVEPICERGDDWADIIDMLTMHPEERRRVARILGEVEAASSSN